MHWRVWMLLALSGVMLFSPWRLRLRQPPIGVLAIITAGPAAEEWQRQGLLDQMKSYPSSNWRGGNLLVIPGASGAEMWRRLSTGIVLPTADAPDLFNFFGVPVYGSWLSPADAAADHLQLERAIAEIDRVDSRSAVLILSCVADGPGLSDPACRDVVNRGVTELAKRSAAGHYGMLLAAPSRGAPEVGTVWVTGPSLKEAPSFRFRDIDLLPTVLYLSGIAIPPAVNGVAGLDLFAGDWLFHHPIEYGKGGT